MKRELLVVGLLGIAVVAFEVMSGDVAGAAPAEVIKEQTLVVIDPAPQVSARAYGVFDVITGELLFGNNTDKALPIASVTKLFTAATALESDYINEVTVITAADVAAEGRAGKLEVGDEYTLHELLFPLLLESSNDAAAVYERTLPSLPFRDASGLSDKNTASVKELAAKVQQLYQTERHIFDITVLPQYVGKETGWVNNSPVRHLEGYQGGKHGYTEAAGKTLVTLFKEPTLGDRTLGYVLLGSDGLEDDLIQLRSFVEQSGEVQ